MIANIDYSAVELFLKTAKKDILKGNMYFVGYRDVSYDGKKVNAKQALLDLNITKISQLWDVVLRLKVNECINISHDYDFKRDFNDDMYEFLTFVNDVKTYIKLTINDKGTLCLSFHKSSK